MSTSPQPRPRVCLLVFGQSVNGAPWALGTLPHEALGGGLRMPRLSRHLGLEKGRKQPHRGLLTANPRAQIKPPNAPGSPSLRRSGAPWASRPASVVPGPPRESRRPTKGWNSSRALLAFRGTTGTPRQPGPRRRVPRPPGTAAGALSARRFRSPGAGRSLTPPWPRSGSASVAQAPKPPSLRRGRGGGRRREARSARRSP